MNGLKRSTGREYADSYLHEIRTDAALWTYAGIRGGHALSESGDVAGWIVTYKQTRVRGETPGWESVVGMRVFVDGGSGEAKLLRT